MSDKEESDSLEGIDLSQFGIPAGSLDGEDFANYRAPVQGEDGNLVPPGGDELATLSQRLNLAENMIRRLEEQLAHPTPAAASGGGVVVKVTGNASGGGKYTGRILTGSSTATASGTLALPEGMTVPGADDALVLNIYETGLTTHDLVSGTFHVGVACGTSAGLTVVMIQGLKVIPC